MSEYTKGKWEIGSICDWEIWVGADVHIADVHGSLPTRHANAQRICQCVNCYDDLVDACERMYEFFTDEMISDDDCKEFVKGVLNEAKKNNP